MLKQFLSAAPVLAEAPQRGKDVVALRPLIRKVAFAYRIRDLDRELEVQAPHDLPYVWGNIDGIQEALCNLVDNAIRHTLPGTHIVLSAEPRGDHVLVRVADGGQGLSDHDEEKIFRPAGFRVQDEPSIEGQGLGLPIARALIVGLGGQLWHEAPPGGGTVFCFTLPCVTDMPGAEGHSD